MVWFRSLWDAGVVSRHRAGILALALTLGSLSPLGMAETMPKLYDCGDRQMKVSEPKNGILAGQIEDFSVEISVRERSGSLPASLHVTVTGPKPDSPSTTTGARLVPEALDAACRIVTRYYKSLEAPSRDDLVKQLDDFYDQL